MYIYVGKFDIYTYLAQRYRECMCTVLLLLLLVLLLLLLLLLDHN